MLFLVDVGVICWDKAILLSHFRYEDRSSSPYGCREVCWERRTLSALVTFVLYHLMCCYNLTEGAHDRLLVRVPDTNKRLDICHLFRCEQELVISYKPRALGED